MNTDSDEQRRREEGKIHSQTPKSWFLVRPALRLCAFASIDNDAGHSRWTVPGAATLCDLFIYELGVSLGFGF
jgi:hypothetical protein